MSTSSPDWSILASENERLVDSRATPAPPRPVPPAARPAPAPLLRWRRRPAPRAAAGTTAAHPVTGAEAPDQAPRAGMALRSSGSG